MQKKGRTTLFMAKKLSWLLRLFMWLTMGSKCNDLEVIEELLKEGSSNLPEPDRKIIQDPKLGKFFARETQEAFRQGSKGAALDAILYALDWGFKLEDISSDLKVHLWHGKLDVNVPISMGRAMGIRQYVPYFRSTQ